MIIGRTLDTEPSHEPDFHVRQRGAVDRESREMLLGHAVGVGTIEIVAVDIDARVSVVRVAAASGRIAEFPGRFRNPARIHIERPVITTGEW